MNSEMAKREFLIAPILVEISKTTKATIDVEYTIDIDEKLSGSLDYLIRLKQQLIIIEAKKGDLEKGFTQLAAELVAFDQYIEQDNGQNLLYGAISLGDVWRFGLLDRTQKLIIKDINSYSVPNDLETVFAILVGIVMGDKPIPIE